MRALNIQVGQPPHNYQLENIAGKSVVIGGGTTGIGLAVARLLVERGARVLIFGRHEKDLKKALTELQTLGDAHGISGDQSKSEDIQRIFKEADAKLGGLDILVNSAAIYAGSILDQSAEKVAYGLNTNVLGYLLCCQEAIKRMKRKRKKNKDGDVDFIIKGHIVNIGSLSADAREEESDVYVATKAAIQAFSESLRKSVNEQGIKVSLIEPGLVWTDLIAETHSAKEAEDMMRQGKILQAVDIAEGVYYVLTQPTRCDVISVQIRPHNQSI